MTGLSEHHGRIAVVTGAASGIGYAIAKRAVAEGMTVVLADVDAAALERSRATLAASGATVHAMAVDVADRDEMASFAARVAGEVGPVWLLVNNAGVFVAAPFIESTLAEWEFVLGVNLWGVVHGMHAFLPGMVERDAGFVINTSSVEGIVTVQNTAAYVASKHAVAAFTETVYRELEDVGSQVRVAVLCPGAIVTDILRSVRHWPDRLGPGPTVREGDYPPLDEVMQPDAVADMVFDAIAQRRFWVLTHPEQYGPAIRARAEEIATGANPSERSVDPNWRKSTGRTPGE